MATGYVGPNGQWVEVADVAAAAGSFTPISLTAGEIASPSAAVLANVWATFQLNVAPFTRYRSTGSALVDIAA